MAKKNSPTKTDVTRTPVIKTSHQLHDDDSAIRSRLKELIDTEKLEALSGLIETEVKNRTQTVDFRYQFTCFLEDGALALNKAVKEVQNYSSYGAKGPSEKPPTTLDVSFADGSHIKVPWGRINLPNMGSEAFISMSYDQANRTMYVNGECERRYTVIIDNIIDRAKEFLLGDSIYRGAAITLNGDLMPKFLNLDSVEHQPMVLTNAAEFALKPIKARIEKPDVCRHMNLPLKFGALLEGDYGTGKTLLAFKLANLAIENDWTFVYLTDPHKTSQALKIVGDLSTNGNGVLFFVEDIDLILAENRDSAMNEIFNILDGGDTKDKSIISIFTTNHLEKINPTFLRGKRIGSIISLGHLDQLTAIKFMENRFPKGISGENLNEVAAKVEDLKIVPAFFAEILDRVQANAIFNDTEAITTVDIEAAIDSYKVQMGLATIGNNKIASKEEVFYDAFRGVIEVGLKDFATSITETLAEIREEL
jgi:hypothetical protein